jgi:hypothetical protein
LSPEDSLGPCLEAAYTGSTKITQGARLPQVFFALLQVRNRPENRAALDSFGALG